MAANSQKMTLEEKVIQFIKSDTLAKLIDDEDSITELAKRAVTEALFADRKVQSGYRIDNKPSPVIEGANNVAAELVKKSVQSLLDDKNLAKLVRDAFIDSLPEAIKRYADANIQHYVDMSKREAMNEIIALKNQNFI